MKHVVKTGNKIKGFVYQDQSGKWWYALGNPSQSNFMAFNCRNLEHGIACIELPLLINNQR